MRLASVKHRYYVAFLLHAIKKLRVKPHKMTKYCAVLFLHERYLPLLDRQTQSCPSKSHDVHLNSLICLWIASKIHETTPIPIRNIKKLAKLLISDHYYTRRDIINAEIKFMEFIGFNLSSGPLVSTYIEELLDKFSRKSTEVGIFVSLKLCLAILDLLYICEDDFLKDLTAKLAGASILAAVYVLGVPNSKRVFPIFTWLQLQTSISVANLKDCTRTVLGCVPAGVETKERAITMLEHIK